MFLTLRRGVSVYVGGQRIWKAGKLIKSFKRVSFFALHLHTPTVHIRPHQVLAGSGNHGTVIVTAKRRCREDADRPAFQEVSGEDTQAGQRFQDTRYQ